MNRKSNQFCWLSFLIQQIIWYNVSELSVCDAASAVRNLEILPASSSSCMLGFFPCDGNASMCVDQQRNCDGVPDCPDGSDEWNCDNKHDANFWDNFFKKRPDEDSEKRKEECAFPVELFPTDCRCASENLFCENRGWTKMPYTFPAEVVFLDLSGNNFPYFNYSALERLTHLETLIMSNNHIQTIGMGVFKGLVSLQKLYLTGNELAALLDGLFQGAESLELLDLSHNRISHIEPGAFRGFKNLTDLDLGNNKITHLAPGMFKELTSLEILHLSGNAISRLQSDIFKGVSTRLKTLSLTHNLVEMIERGAFRHLLCLKMLYLSWNKLSYLENRTFGELISLENLQLNDNELFAMDVGAFEGLANLQSLNLKNNNFRRLRSASSIFLPMNLTLEYVYFDEFYMCSYALFVRVCEPKGDGISSVEHMLDSVLLRVCVWVMAFVACFGNVFVLVGRLMVKEPNAVHSFYIKNLAMADLCMGAYLLLIAAYDQHFRGDFIYHQKNWQESWQCELCGFLSTLSSEASVLILGAITLDRFLSIIHPFAQKRHTLRLASCYMAALWGVAALFAMLPMTGLEYWGDSNNSFYGSNGVCLPLHIHDPYGQAWEYSAALYLGVNTAALMFIAYAYVRMLGIIRGSAPTLRTNQEKQDRLVAQRFAFIVGTDCLCWFPIVVIKCLALAGVKIQKDLYAWLAVFVLPVNSALNPIIYTLTTKLFRQQMMKLLYGCRSSVTRTTGTRGGGTGGPDDSSLAPSYALLYRARTNKGCCQNNSASLQSSVKSTSLSTSVRYVPPKQ